MRYLFVLLLSVPLYADSLRVECSADGFIANVTAARTTGSFTIQGASAGDDAMCLMDEGNPTTNASANTTHRLGYFNSADQRCLLRFPTLPDSMRAKASGKIIQWDSARVVLNVSAALTSGDSLTIAMYELRSGRIFSEANATWNQYDISSNWGTAGAGNTSTDIDNANYDTTAWLTNATTSAGTDISWKLNSAAITDTINNNAGLVLRRLSMGGNDGVTSTISVSTDDNATAGDRPKITVYYTELDYVNFGGSDSLIAKSTSSAPTHMPIFTFDISALSATSDLDSCRLWSYVLNNYSSGGDNTQLTRVIQMMKPTNIGDNNGTVADNGEMDWVAWDERGSGNDSNWTVAGAGDEGSTCNRSDGSDDDQDLGADFSVYWSSTGWQTLKFDTLYVRQYLNGSCNNFALGLSMFAGASDVTFYKLEADEKSGSANKTWITIYYTPVAATVSRGTGRLGRDNTGVYRNDR